MDKLQALYDKLSSDGLYTKSFDEFVTQFSEPSSQQALHEKLSSDGLYTKSYEEFQNQFFSEVKKKDQPEQPDDSSVVEDGTSGVEDGSLDSGEQEDEVINQIFPEIKDADGNKLPTNLSPDDTSYMVDISQAFPQIKNLPSEKKNFNSRLVDPKVAQFLAELQEIYPEEDFNNLDITSLFRDQKHHRFYEAEREGRKPESNVHSRHKHGLAMDVAGESGKKLMTFLYEDPKGQALAKKWGSGGNLKNGIHDEYGDMYKKQHNLNHLHFSFKRGQIDNTDYVQTKVNINKKPEINLGEDVDLGDFAEASIEEVVEETTPEEEGSMDNPGLYGRFNSQEVVENPEIFDEYSIDFELQKLYNPEITEEEKNTTIQKIKEKAYNAEGNQRLVHKFPVKELLGSDGEALVGGRDVYLTYDVDENGEKTYKVVDPILGEFVSSSKTKQNTIRELNKKIQQKRSEADETRPRQISSFKDEFGIGMPVFEKESEEHAKIKEEIFVLESQLNELVSSPSGERDALTQWILSNQATFLSKGGEMKDLSEFNKDSKGEIGLFLNAMNTAYNDAPFTTDTPGELLSMDILDYDGYTEGEGLTSLLTNEASDLKGISVNPRTILDDLLGEEKIEYEGRLSEQIDAIKMINNDETLKLYWQLYNFSGFDNNFTSEDYKRLQFLDKKYGEKVYNKKNTNPAEIIKWLELQERRQTAFSIWSAGQLRKVTERVTSQLEKNGGLKEFNDLIDEVGSLTDEQIIIKNKIEKPQGYIYFDKEEAEEDQKLLERFNEINKIKKELEQEGEDLKKKYPEFNTFDGINKTQDILTNHALALNEQRGLLEEHERWKRNAKKEADEKYRDKNGVGKALSWLGDTAIEGLAKLGKSVAFDFPRLLDGFLRNEYNELDALSDGANDLFNDGLNRVFGDDSLNQKGAGGFSQYTVDMGNGFKVMVDRNGEPMETYYEDEDGFMIRTDYDKNQELLKKYTDNKDEYEIKKETNYTAGFNMLTDAVTTFAGDVALTYGTFGVGSAVGLGKYAVGSANTWRKVAMGTSMWVNHSGNLYNMAKEQGMTDRESSSYATLMSVLFGLSNAYISPNLGILGATSKMAKGKTNTAMLSMILGNASKQNTLTATSKHMLIEGFKEAGQELVDENLQSLVGQVYNQYKGTDFEKLNYDQARDAAIAGFVIGSVASISSRPTTSSMQVASLHKAYKYKDNVFQSLDKMVGETININGKRVKLTKSFINSRKQKLNRLFEQVNSLKSQPGVKLNNESEAILLSLINRRNNVEAFQNDKKFGPKFKQEMEQIDNQVSRLLNGESVDSIFYKESSFDKLGIDSSKVSYAGKLAERLFRTGGKFSRSTKGAIEQELESDIDSLNNKKKPTPEDKKILATYRSLLKKVKKVKPDINEEITETTKLAIQKTSPGLRAKIEQLVERLKSKGITENFGNLSATEEISIDDTSTFKDALGRTIKYGGRNGKLVLNKNGQYAIESGGRRYKIDNATNRKMLKTVGVGIDPVVVSIDGDKLVVNRGKEKRVLEVVRGAGNNVGGVLTVDNDTFSDKRKLNRIRKQLNKLSGQYANGEINLSTFRNEASKISGVELITDKDISLDVAANQLISQIMNSIDVASISMNEIDNIIAEAQDELDTLQELEGKFQKAVTKEVTDSRKARGKALTPGKRVKKGQQTLLDMSKKEPNRRKSKILKIAHNVMSSIGFDVVVHSDSNSVYEHFILNGASHQYALNVKNTRGFIYEKNGTIHFNLETASLNTMFHEGAHPFVSVLQNLAKQKGDKANDAKKILQEAKEFLSKRNIGADKDNGTYIDWAERSYPNLSKDEQLTEALAEYLGDSALEVYEKDNSWSKGIWRRILGLFGVNVDSDFDAYSKTMEEVSDLGEFTEVFSTSLARGQELDPGQIEGTDPKFQAGTEVQLNNLEQAVNSIQTDRSTKQEILKQIDIHSTPLTNLELTFSGLENYLEGLKLNYDDQLIPIQAVKDYINMNKVSVDATKENELSLKNPIMDLGKVKFRMDDSIDESGPRTMVVENFDGVDFGSLETVFKNIIKYAVDSDVPRVVFSSNVITNESSIDVLEEATQSIDPNSDIGITELDGESVPQVVVSNGMIENTTKINNPKFQAAGRDILDSQTQTRFGIIGKKFGFNLNTIKDWFVVGGIGSGAVKELRALTKGRQKSYIDKGEYLVKELQKVLKKYPDITMENVNDVLTDPTNSKGAKTIKRSIRLIKEEIKSLDVFKEKSVKYKKLEKTLKLKEEQLRNLYEGHKNKRKLDSMPDDVKEKIKEIRAYIDNLSQMLIDSGLLSDELSVFYSENKGIYLTRSYKAHQQKEPTGFAAGALKFLSEKVFGKEFQDLDLIKRNHKLYNSAKQFFRKQIFDSMSDSEKSKRKISKPEDVPEYEVDEIIGEILNPVDGESPIMILNKVGPQIAKYLKGRKTEEQLPKIIRDILGEVDNPFLNILTTVTKQINLLEGSRYQNFLVEMYQDKLLFDPSKPFPKELRDMGFTNNDLIDIQLMVDGEMKTFRTVKAAADAMLGKTTPGQVATAGTQGVHKAVLHAFNGYFYSLGLFKLFKTVFSFATQANNFRANIGYSIRNLHLNFYKHGFDGFTTTFKAMGKWNDAKKQELYRELLEFGVIESAGVSELKMMLEEGGSDFLQDPNFNPMREIMEIKPGFLGANWLKSGLSKVKKAALATYLFGDASWKANAWLHEVDRYKKVGYSDFDAKRIASQIVRATYPTYENVPKAVKAVGLIPDGGLFVSYPFEVYRTSFNMVDRSRKEVMEGLKRKNPELTKLGMTRLLSSTLAMFYSGVVAKAQIMAFMFLVKSIKTLLGDEEEEERKLDETGEFVLSEMNFDYMLNNEMSEDFRIFMPHYYEDNHIMIVSHPDTGVWKYINASREDAFGNIKSTLRQFTNPIENPTYDYIFQNKTIHALLGDFLPGNKQKVAEIIEQVRKNDKNLDNDFSGDVIWREGDSGLTKQIKALKHIYKDFSPTTIKHITDIVKAANQQPQEGIKEGWRRVEEGEELPRRAVTENLLDGSGKIVKLKSIDEDYDLGVEIRRILGYSESEIDLARQFRFLLGDVNFKTEFNIKESGRTYEEMIDKSIDLISHIRDVYNMSMKYGLGHMEYVARDKSIGVMKGNGGIEVALTIMNDLKLTKDFANLVISDRKIEDMPEFKELIRGSIERKLGDVIVSDSREGYEILLKRQKVEDKR